MQTPGSSRRKRREGRAGAATARAGVWVSLKTTEAAGGQQAGPGVCPLAAPWDSPGARGQSRAPRPLQAEPQKRPGRGRLLPRATLETRHQLTQPEPRGVNTQHDFKRCKEQFEEELHKGSVSPRAEHVFSAKTHPHLPERKLLPDFWKGDEQEAFEPLTAAPSAATATSFLCTVSLPPSISALRPGGGNIHFSHPLLFPHLPPRPIFCRS